MNGANWHTDDSFMREPCSLTMLYGVVVPSRGGDTQFTNMYAAYEDLPAETQAAHRSAEGGAQVPFQPQADPRLDAAGRGDGGDARGHASAGAHPSGDRPQGALSQSQPHGAHRRAWSSAESDRLLDELIAHATQPKYQYRHVWRQGDIVIWDNRCTMHKANADYPEGERRLMHRVIVAGTAPV